MREFKYRFYDTENNKIYYSDKDSDIFFEKFMYCSKNDIKLMQYTEFKDKNSTDVYEGDILDLYDTLYLVFWDSKMGSWCLKSKEKDLFIFQVHTCETIIVGNKFENKDLLKEIGV